MIFKQEILSCSNCCRQKKIMNNACDNCSDLLRCIEYLQNKMGTKSLNQILEQKTSSLRTGLGFDPYAHSKTHAPTIVKPFGSGKIEIRNEPKEIVFESAGVMPLTSTVNANITRTSHVKHKVSLW
jgi:hypothetical protein